MPNIRTQLTPKKLKESIGVLNDIINACMACGDGPDASWVMACRKNNLDPLAARRVVLALEKCADVSVPLKEMDLGNLYNGYEKFYQAVFGDRILQDASLPFDYKESVLYVVRHTGFTDREAFILTHRFGIDGCEMPETLQEVGKRLSICQNRVHEIQSRLICRCLDEPRAMILKNGIAEYNLLKEQAKELTAERLKEARDRYEARMREKEAGYKDRMAAIKAGLSTQMPQEPVLEELCSQLASQPVSMLGTNSRILCALRRNGITDLSGLIRHSRGYFMKLHQVGQKSVDEMLAKLDDYIQDCYGISADDLRRMLSDT